MKYSLEKKIKKFATELNFAPSFKPGSGFLFLSDVLQNLDRAKKTTSDAIEITSELRNAILHDIGAATPLDKS